MIQTNEAAPVNEDDTLIQAKGELLKGGLPKVLDFLALFFAFWGAPYVLGMLYGKYESYQKESPCWFVVDKNCQLDPFVYVALIAYSLLLLYIIAREGNHFVRDSSAGHPCQFFFKEKRDENSESHSPNDRSMVRKNN